MEKTVLIQTIIWENIAVHLTYKPHYLSIVSLLEVRADEPLPFTATGYRSIFLDNAELDTNAIKEYVVDYLNTEAKKTAWKSYLKTKKEKQLAEQQFSLF